MRDNLTHFMLIVKDVGISAAFYRDKLGFVLDYETPEWAELKMPNGMELALKRRSSGDPVGSGGFGFAVKDCRAATEAMRERGVEIVMECEKRESEGHVLSQFRDPDGDIIWMVQKI